MQGHCSLLESNPDFKPHVINLRTFLTGHSESSIFLCSHTKLEFTFALTTSVNFLGSLPWKIKTGYPRLYFVVFHQMMLRAEDRDYSPKKVQLPQGMQSKSNSFWKKTCSVPVCPDAWELQTWEMRFNKQTLVFFSLRGAELPCR